MGAVQGWKVSTLEVVGGRFCFGGLTAGDAGGTTFGPDEEATCAKNHPAPAGGCTCGFHAVVERSEEHLGRLRHPGRVELVVELSGRLCGGETATELRGQRQRVLAVHVPLRCAEGHKIPEPDEASFAVEDGRVRLRGACHPGDAEPMSITALSERYGLPMCWAPWPPRHASGN